MIIRPKQKLSDLFFYNNIIFIFLVFGLICLFTSMFIGGVTVNKVTLPSEEEVIVGPIKIDNKSQIIKVYAYWDGYNDPSYLIGEVLDEEKDTLYEIGKEFWFESGRDDEGYWEESVRNMEAFLTFKEKGTYYLKFSTESGGMRNINLTVSSMKWSYIPHSMVGSLAILVALFLFCCFNKTWVLNLLVNINEKLEDIDD